MIHREDLIEFSKFVLSLALGEGGETKFVYNRNHLDNAVKLIRIRFLPVPKEERVKILKSDTTVNALVDSLDVDGDCIYFADLDSFIEQCDTLITKNNITSGSTDSSKAYELGSSFYSSKEVEDNETINSDASGVTSSRGFDKVGFIEDLDKCPLCGSRLTSEGICLNVSCIYGDNK